MGYVVHPVDNLEYRVGKMIYVVFLRRGFGFTQRSQRRQRPQRVCEKKYCWRTVIQSLTAILKIQDYVINIYSRNPAWN